MSFHKFLTGTYQLISEKTLALPLVFSQDC
jgi:hypothetical protein